MHALLFVLGRRRATFEPCLHVLQPLCRGFEIGEVGPHERGERRTDPEAGLLGLVVCAKATVAIMVAPATTARAAGKCMDLSPMMRRNINA